MHFDNKKYNRSLRSVFLMVVFLVSFGACFFSYGGSGVVDGDGMVYYRSAVTDIAIGKWILAGKQYDIQKYFVNRNMAPVSNYYAKPFWHLINVGSLLVLGDNDNSIPVTNGIFAIASALMVFLLGELLFGTRAGFLAALLLVPMPIFLWHGRTGMAHMPQLLFLLLGLYFYIREFRKGGNIKLLLCAGTFLGLSVLTHASSLLYIVCFWIFELYRYVRKNNSLLQFVQRSLLLLLPFVILAILINFGYVFFIQQMGDAGKSLFPVDGWFAYNSYFEQVKYNFVGTRNFLFEQPIDSPLIATRLFAIVQSYIYDVYIYEGWLLIAFIFSGWMYCAYTYFIKKDVLLLLLFLAVLLPYCILLFGPLNPDSRLLVPVFALSSIAVGFLADSLWGKQSFPFGKTLVVIIVCYSFYNVLPIYNVRSGYKEIVNYLTKNNVKTVYTIDTRVQVSSILEVYNIQVKSLDDWTELAELDDGQYVVLSYREGFFNPPDNLGNVDFCRKLFAEVPPFIEDYFLPEHHAMEIERRRWSPFMDYIIQGALGKNYKRKPFPVALYKASDLKGFFR